MLLLRVMMIFYLPFGPLEGASGTMRDPSGSEKLVVESNTEHPNTQMFNIFPTMYLHAPTMSPLTSVLRMILPGDLTSYEY